MSHTPQNDAIFQLTQALLKHYPSEQVIQPAELDWMMQWLRTVSPDDEKFQDNTAWNHDLMTLGLVHPTHAPNLDRAKQVSAYIWSQRACEPNYTALKHHLDDLDTQRQQAIKQQLKTMQKRKKVRRKKGRFKNRR